MYFLFIRLDNYFLAFLLFVNKNEIRLNKFRRKIFVIFTAFKI